MLRTFAQRVGMGVRGLGGVRTRWASSRADAARKTGKDAVAAAREKADAASSSGSLFPTFTRSGVVVASVAFAVAAGSYGVYMADGDDTAYLVEEGVDLLVAREWDTICLEDVEGLANATNTNDTLKANLGNSPHALLQLLHVSAESPELELRAHASKTLDNVFRSQAPGVAKSGLDDAFLPKMVALINDKEMTLVVRKNLASALASLVSNVVAPGGGGEEKREEEVGALVGNPQVHAALASVDQNVYIRRRVFREAAKSLAVAAVKSPSVALDAFPAEVREDVVALAGEAERQQSSFLSRSSSSLIDSGLLLYLHTAAGGGVWGALQAFRANGSAAAILRAAVRTSLVTSLVPITVVGGMVTAYNHVRRQMDDAVSLMAFHTGSILVLYPLIFIMPAIDRWAPMWIGGHVVGFVSFFAYLYATDADLLKADGEILMRDSAIVQSKGLATSPISFDP